MKIDWKRKLSSRKFWAALIGFITAILVAINFTEAEIAQITAIVSAFATLIIYILTEGYVDGKRERKQQYRNLNHALPLLVGLFLFNLINLRKMGICEVRSNKYLLFYLIHKYVILV